MTLPISPSTRRTTDSTRARRARCSGATRAAATELRRAADRAQAVLADDAVASAPARAPRAASAAGVSDAAPRAASRDRAAGAASARSARVADAVVAQWLLEQVPRHGARRVRTAA